MQEKRFKMIYNQGTVDSVEIWVDTQTGVNYMFRYSGYAGGLTPLLDENGNAIITKDI